MLGELLIVVSLDDRLVAFPAIDVDSIVDLDRISPVPRAPAHVRGLATQRSRPLTVIDCRAAIGLPPASATEADGRAPVVVRDKHHYALMVDRLLDAVPAEGAADDVTGAVGRNWLRIARGRIATPLGDALVIDIGALIDGCETELAA